MKILLVTTSQFGYLVDYYRYYVYLKKKGHDVKYICIDYGKEKIESGNPDIFYIKGSGNKLVRHFHFIQGIIRLEKQFKFDRIMLHVFPVVSSLLTFVPRSKMYLDIRTVSIHRKFYKRSFFDFLIKVASRLFRHTSAITDIAAQQIGIRKYKLLPLGGAYFGDGKTDASIGDQYHEIFNSGDYIFIYVGTLNKRGIIDCVKGFHSFKKNNPGARIRFVIIGKSIGNELNEIEKYVEKHQLQSYIHTLGYIPNSRLSFFFNHADCGISFMPLSAPFSKQPNTKTYEYLVNGIPVMAIASEDNIKMIQDSKVPCGVIIEDTPSGVEDGIKRILQTKSLYVRSDIAREFKKYEWDNVFNIYLEDALSLSAS